MMYWYGTGGSWWVATLMWVGMLAFWALIIWAIYLLVVGVSRRDAGVRPIGHGASSTNVSLEARSTPTSTAAGSTHSRRTDTATCGVGGPR